MVDLLERERELAAVMRVVGEARVGTGAAVLVWGPAGIGKSSVLSAAADCAASSGLRVLRARGAELEREFGFGVVRQLLEPALAASSEHDRTEWMDGAAGSAGRLLGLPGATQGRPAQATPADVTFAVLHGLYWLMAQMAESGPLCVIIDDAQWSDVASIRFLDFLHTRLAELPIAVIVAIRFGESSPTTALLNRFENDRNTEALELAPLSREAVAALLTEGLDRTPDQALVRRCDYATGGNPFLVRQLVAQWRDQGTAAVLGEEGELQAGPAIARWTLARLARLGPEAERLAHAAAVLEDSQLDVAAALAGLSPEAAADASAALMEAEILKPALSLTFVHPLVRRALYDSIDRARRAEVHRNAATLLDAHGSHAAVVAEHLLATRPVADEWVVARLREAGHQATTRGAFESAVAYLRRALNEPPPADAVSAILLALGQAEWNTGDDDALDHLRRGTAAAIGQQRADAAVTLAYAMAGVRHPRLADAVHIIEDAQGSNRGDIAPTTIKLMTAAASINALDAGLATTDQSRIRTARARAAHPDAAHDELALAAFLATLGNEPVSQVAALIGRMLRRRSEQFPEPRDTLGSGAIMVHSMTALVCSEDSRARRALEAALDNARRSGTSPMQACALVFRAQLNLQRGDLRSAEADSQGAFDMSQMPVLGYMHALNMAITLQVLVEQDRLDAAEAQLDSGAAEARATLYPDARLRLARGQVRLAQRRPDEALEDLLHAGELAVRADMDSPSWLPWRSRAALACLELGDEERARALASVELDLARHFAAPRTLGVAMHVAGMTTDGQAGEHLLHEAIRTLSAAGAVLDRAQVQCDLGARLRRRNRRTESRELLRAALDTTRKIGAVRVARAVETELRAAGGRPRTSTRTGIDALTASERRIAELAASGLTNRRIAQTLFVTERTVEGHLTATFRKLDIESRDELATALHPDEVHGTR